MCDRLLTRSQARDILRKHGLTDWTIRTVLTIHIPPHAHQLHTRRLWLHSHVKTWLDTRLANPQPSTTIPGEECRPLGALKTHP